MSDEARRRRTTILAKLDEIDEQVAQLLERRTQLMLALARVEEGAEDDSSPRYPEGTSDRRGALSSPVIH